MIFWAQTYNLELNWTELTYFNVTRQVRCQLPWPGPREVLCWCDPQQIPGLLCWLHSTGEKSAHITTVTHTRDHPKQQNCRTCYSESCISFYLNSKWTAFMTDKLSSESLNCHCWIWDIIGSTREQELESALRELHWLPVTQHIQCKVLSTLYWSVKGSALLYLLELPQTCGLP